MSKLAMSLLLLTFATPVWSQPGGFGRRGPMQSPAFQTLAAAPTMLKKLDGNGDGQLSADEVRINFGPGLGPGLN